MNALALVIGNNDYLLEKNKLNNAVNDANSISKKLLQLGFVVDKITDCNIHTFATSISEFMNKLDKYDVALFYFAGHGFQIDGINYLSAIDTDFNDSGPAKHTSISIDEIFRDFIKVKSKIKIMILDACRDNPFSTTFRGGGYNPGLAPIYAPKGTIVAFSTSPGEKAQDGDPGSNSIYTKSIIKHIDDKNIPIEEFFKRVRTSVYSLSGGKQLSWEHTSLIGDYYFNSGQMIHAIELPYSQDVVADSQHISKGSEAEQIIEGLKSYYWYTQSPAFDKFRKLKPNAIDKNIQFLLGRNILQTAIGGEFSASDYFQRLAQNIERWNIDGENHLLNGILYEIYFDSNGRLRQGLKFKSELIGVVFGLEEDVRYKSSFDFLLKQLTLFKDFLFYIPSDKPVNVPLELEFEEIANNLLGDDHREYKLKAIKHKGADILKLDEDGTFYYSANSQMFIEELSFKMCVPINRFTISSNFNFENKELKLPRYYNISTI